MKPSPELADACLLLWQKEVENLEIQIDSLFWSLEPLLNQPCPQEETSTLSPERYLVSDFIEHQQQKMLKIHIQNIATQATELILQKLLEAHTQLGSLVVILSQLNGKQDEEILEKEREEQCLFFVPETEPFIQNQVRLSGFLEGYLQSLNLKVASFHTPFSTKNQLHIILDKEFKSLLQPIERYLHLMAFQQ